MSQKLDDDVAALDRRIQEAVAEFERAHPDTFVARIEAGRMLHYSTTTGEKIRDFVGPLNVKITVDANVDRG